MTCAPLSSTLEPYLEDLEQRIDPAVEDDLWHSWTEFLEGRFSGDIFSPHRARVTPPSRTWPKPSVNAALDDPEQMLLQQYRMCSEILTNSDSGSMLGVRANYGTGILPSIFGASIFRMEESLNTLPTSRPLGGADAVRKLLDEPLPDIHTGQGGQCFDIARRFRAIAETYPNIALYVHPYHPDLQGPMDVCELLWGSDLFVDLYDEPELVHALLDRITTVYAHFMREWNLLFPPRHAPYSVHWDVLTRGQIFLREDSAMNLSPEMFEEFITPYDTRLLQEFGGGAIHFCGRGDHYIARACAMPGLHVMNLSQPEYNNMETIFAGTVDQGIPLLRLRRVTAEQALASGRDLHHLVHSTEPAGK